MSGRILLLIALVAAAVAAIVGYRAMQWADGPVVPSDSHPPSQVVVIPDGATFQQVASLLEQAKLIRSKSRLLMLGKSTGADRRIISGEYELSPAMAPKDILAKIRAGQVILHTITIPEGYSIAQMAEVLDIDDYVDAKEFLRLARDTSFVHSLGIEAPTLEGYLFPDTYRVARGTKAKDFIQTMVAKLWQVFTPEWKTLAQTNHMTPHQVLTMASVIEKETGAGQERRLISAVFHNRLKKNIPLQSDPTVIYGLESFDGNIHKKDLSNPSPYNTYRVRGLPPGPIASPGAQSIEAALKPADEPFLYFVSRNDGTHQFSSTLVQHNEAVEKYQKKPFRRAARPQA
ncbi:MAG: endolytic transglycosylase MltG [Nitrospiraceae bacterium]